MIWFLTFPQFQWFFRYLNAGLNCWPFIDGWAFCDSVIFRNELDSFISSADLWFAKMMVTWSVKSFVIVMFIDRTEFYFSLEWFLPFCLFMQFLILHFLIMHFFFIVLWHYVFFLLVITFSEFRLLNFVVLESPPNRPSIKQWHICISRIMWITFMINFYLHRLNIYLRFVTYVNAVKGSFNFRVTFSLVFGFLNVSLRRFFIVSHFTVSHSSPIMGDYRQSDWNIWKY